MTDLSAHEQVVEGWLSPISDAQPCGEEDDLDERYVLVDQAVRGSSATPPDWPGIVKPAQGYLQEKAKDLKTLVVLTLGLYRGKGPAGLATGLLGISKALERYPDELHPVRAKRRRAPITLLEEKLVAWLPETKETLTAKDGPGLDEAIEALQVLQGTLKKHVPDVSVSMLNRQLIMLKGALPVAAPPPPPPPPPEEEDAGDTDDLPTTPGPEAAPPPPPPPRAPAAAVATPEPVSSAGVELGTYLRRTGKQIATLAANLQSANPADPEPYRLRRAGMWLPFSGAPGADGDKKTLAPSADTANLERMVSAGKFAEALRDAEAVVDDRPFALDLHAIVAKALKALGPQYKAALDAVEGEVAAFLRRAPELPELFANDGKPFASDDTKAWIATLGGGGGGGGGGVAVAPSGGAVRIDASDLVGSDTVELVEKAASMAEEGDAASAIAYLEVAAKAATSARERFRVRLEIAKLALGAGELALAAGVLTDLDREAEAHGLVNWEPTLGAELLVTWLDYLKAAKTDDAARIRDVYERLCAVDPGAAVGRAP